MRSVDRRAGLEEDSGVEGLAEEEGLDLELPTRKTMSHFTLRLTAICWRTVPAKQYG